MDIPVVNYNDYKFDFEKFIQESVKLAKKSKSLKILIPLDFSNEIEEKTIESLKKKGIKTLNFEPEIVFFAKNKEIPVDTGLNLISSFKSDKIEIVLMKNGVVKESKTIELEEKVFIEEISKILNQYKDIRDRGMVLLNNTFGNLAKKLDISVVNL